MFLMIGPPAVRMVVKDARSARAVQRAPFYNAWGLDGTVHIGDFNGDEKKDLLMWRSVDSTWSVNLSTGTGFSMNSWSSAPTLVPLIKSFTADQTMLKHEDDPIIVRYSIGVPAACKAQGTYTAFDPNGNPIGNSEAPIDATGAGSITILGYPPPVSFQLMFMCQASSACTQPAVVRSGFLKITGPPMLKITQFQAAGNGLVATAGKNLYVPVGTSVALSWQIQNCTTNCSVSLTGLDGLNYDTTFFAKSGLSSAGSLNVAPTQTNTKYILRASGPDGNDSQSLTVQLYTTSQPCSNCSWYYFQLASPSGSTPECFTTAVWASSEQAAQQVAQAKAENYTITQITEAQYYAGCQ